MNKLLIIILGCIFVGGLVFAGYSLSTDSESKDKADNTQSESESKDKTGDVKPEDAKDSEISKDEDKEESFFGSMQDLIARGKSLKCTYKTSSSDGGDEYETVMYISGGNVKTETEIKTEEGKTMENHMAINKDWMYMWNSFMPKGMKADMSKMPEMDNVTDSDINKDMANLAKNMDYKCRTWIPNSSKFKIPTDIQFEDITEMMAGMAEEIGNMTEEDIKEMEDEANKFICDHCKNAPTPELMKECLGDVVCD